MGAAGPALPRRDRMAGRRVGFDRADISRRLPSPSGQGRGHLLGRRRLCPAGAQARRGRRIRGDRGRFDSCDPVQAPGRYSGR